MEQLVARKAHTLEVGGSSPPRATIARLRSFGIKTAMPYKRLAKSHNKPCGWRKLHFTERNHEHSLWLYSGQW